MKYPRLFSYLIAYLIVAGTALCGVNVFLERTVMIAELENRGDPTYDYLAESLMTSTFSYALSIPFLTLTDEEREALEQISQREEFTASFEAAGKRVGYKLTPRIQRSVPEGQGAEMKEEGWPLVISGSFTVVTEGEVKLALRAFNTLIKRQEAAYTVTLPLATLLNEPEVFLVPFFKSVLRYKTYVTSFESLPRDALIFIDGRFAGVGTVKNILLSRGEHRISAKRDGYNEYSDILYIDEDGQVKKITLTPVKRLRVMKILSQPGGAFVYIDEQFMGITPLEVSLPDRFFTFSFMKEGYKTATVKSTDLSENQEELNIQLLTVEAAQSVVDRAETHRKRAKILAYTGVAMLGVSIFFAVEKTLNAQRADLEEGRNQDRFEEASDREEAYTYLTIGSFVATGTIFTFSFVQMAKYFNLYNLQSDMAQSATGGNITLFKKEVRF
jgi:hypothetical protein